MIHLLAKVDKIYPISRPIASQFLTDMFTPAARSSRQFDLLGAYQANGADLRAQTPGAAPRSLPASVLCGFLST
jgi:hypothetical protein